MKKNKDKKIDVVYSTNPDFQYSFVNESEQETLPASEQKLKIRLETKHRAGKTVTAILGFVGKTEDMEELGKALKSYCGTGGSAKEGEIIVQGDHREKCLRYLLSKGYQARII